MEQSSTSEVQQFTKGISDWQGRRIGITGAKGSLGKALTKTLRKKGAVVIGLTHSNVKNIETSVDAPNEWVQWDCGNESAIDLTLKNLDVLILNHGINPKGNQSISILNTALEVNALSSWRLIERFEAIAFEEESNPRQREIWINTSEAEIQPALSPAYEISKRLIGQLASIRWANLDKSQREILTLRKLVLGPFRSNLNPIGLMGADLVAKQIIKQADLKFNLIIVTPNPLTYILMPIVECSRSIYYRLMKKFD